MSEKKKKIREAFRNAVFKRDGFHCKFCEETLDLDAHHITDRNLLPNGGYVKENGITLCPKHHEEAEVWHSTNGVTFVDGMTPTDLYKKIGSTYEEALKFSKLLDKS